MAEHDGSHESEAQRSIESFMPNKVELEAWLVWYQSRFLPIIIVFCTCMEGPTEGAAEVRFQQKIWERREYRGDEWSEWEALQISSSHELWSILLQYHFVAVRQRGGRQLKQGAELAIGFLISLDRLYRDNQNKE